uniref:Uncharacterized protein n=1 Tax=Zonotrichia albicollis TaxID=44394 RepID=A0A8D2N4Y0_ZONAL
GLGHLVQKSLWNMQLVLGLSSKKGRKRRWGMERHNPLLPNQTGSGNVTQMWGCLVKLRETSQLTWRGLAFEPGPGSSLVPQT